MNPHVRKEYDWFFDAIEGTFDKYEWKEEENGNLQIFDRETGKEVVFGQLCEEHNGWVPEFGLQGMATSRALGPHEHLTKFSGFLREGIHEITGVGKVEDHTPYDQDN